MKRILFAIPDTLFGRIALILLASVLLTQLLTFGSIWYERSIASRTMMLSYVTRDIASSIAILERLPSHERKAWLDRLERNNYRYLLNTAHQNTSQSSPLLSHLAQSIGDELKHEYPIRQRFSHAGKSYLDLTLKDGTPLSIELSPGGIPLTNWLPALLTIELMLLCLGAWLSVRIAARPLSQLAQAAEQLIPGHGSSMLNETGPSEVAQAARAFNAMQARINIHLQERTHILAAISHDLQTPITRMRLRAELLPETDKTKWISDLESMQALVREGIDYAKSTEPSAEPPKKVDLNSLVAALVADYQDAGYNVTIVGQSGQILMTFPNHLRRIIANLVDNAIKFTGAAVVEIITDLEHISIMVLDRGIGIPENQLNEVLQPFYRLEPSRNNQTGGSGLGLAIADQLAKKCGGQLRLSNRKDGGLCATLSLQCIRFKP